MDNSLEAFASNPRYSPDGLDGEIDKEEWATAERVSAEQAAIADLQQEPPKLGAMEIKQDDSFDVTGMHEKILGVVDNATRVPRDIVGGVTKAIDNTMSLAIGRENVDAANQWLKDEMPELVKITSSFEKGIAPQGTVSEVTQELSQFAIPFGAYMKGLKALSVAGGVEAGAFTTGFLSDVITSGTALDPHVERLSTMARDMGVDNKIVGWLADNENETDSEGRLKNILENTGLGLGAAAAITSVILPLKGMWRLSKEIPNMPRSPSMGSPQAQRGSISLKDAGKTSKNFTLGDLPRDMREELFNEHAMNLNPEATEKGFYSKPVPRGRIKIEGMVIDEIPSSQLDYHRTAQSEDLPPIVISDGKLIDGQHRIQLARERGIKELDYIDVTGLIDTERGGYISELPKIRQAAKNPKKAKDKKTEDKMDNIIKELKDL